MDPADAVLTFLRSVGTHADAEYYLRMFREGPAERFAAIAVDAATMASSGDAVALDLRFLSQLELTPVVVLGLRDPDAASEDAERLREQLAAAGVGVATHGDGGDLDIDSIAATARAATIPVVALGEPAADAREASLSALLDGLQTRKLIFLRNRGGLRQHGERLSVVNLSDELEGLSKTPDFDDADRRLLAMASRLLSRPEPGERLIALTSPINLLHELFTLRGAGTLLRRGASITRFDGLSGLDRPRLEGLLEESFGRAPRAQLFERNLTHSYLDAHYRGAALIEATDDWGYLTKFAVTRRAQGEGLGRDLWQAIAADYPRLVWRARRDNPVTPWYEANCDGRLRSERWTAYFRGIDADDIAGAVRYALSQPEDF